MHKSKTLRYLLLPLLFFSFYSSTQEHDTKEMTNTLSAAKTFIIGVEALDYYPWYSFDYLGREKPSFTRDLLSHFFNSRGYSYKFLALPIKRFNSWYVERGIDFKFPDNIHWREEESVKLAITYSDPVIKLTAGTYVLKSNEYLQRDDVTKLGTISGFYPTFWHDKIAKQETELVESTTALSTVKHLLYSYVTAINIDKNVINYHLEKLASTQQVVLNAHIKSESYHYYFSSIEYPQIIAEFNQYLRDNKGLIAELKRQYRIIED